jgi:hypothetical protein
VNDDGDALLDRLGGRVVEDAETGQRYRLWEDADALRDAADTGEVELADLRYGGGHRSDLDALLAEEDELA